MSVTYNPTNSVQGTSRLLLVLSVFKGFWGAVQEWRKWERLRADLGSLSDQELMDIGISRGEIDYVASNRDADPRGIRSA